MRDILLQFSEHSCADVERRRLCSLAHSAADFCMDANGAQPVTIHLSQIARDAPQVRAPAVGAVRERGLAL